MLVLLESRCGMGLVPCEEASVYENVVNGLGNESFFCSHRTGACQISGTVVLADFAASFQRGGGGR